MPSSCASLPEISGRGLSVRTATRFTIKIPAMWSVPCLSGAIKYCYAGARLNRATVSGRCRRVVLLPLFSLLNVVRAHQVHLFYRARLIDLDVRAGDESLEVRLFKEAQIPWEQIAFRTVDQTLRFFFADRQDGRFGLHTADIESG